MSTPKPELKMFYRTSSEVDNVILWVSRHPPLYAQITELEMKLGKVEIYMLSGTVPNAEYVVNVAKKVGAKYIVPVLPLSIIARLTELAKKEGFTVLWAEMEQVMQTIKVPKEIDEKREVIVVAHGTYKVMRFKKFHKIKAIKLELEEL